MKDKKRKHRRGIFNAAAGAVRASLVTRRQEHGQTGTTNGTPIELSRGDVKVALSRTLQALGSRNLSALAASVAYYSTLAFFPFLAASVAIAALMISPEQLTALIGAAEAYLPSDISGIVARQLENLVARREDNFIAAIIALAVALYGASGASKSLVTASNVAYGVKESRGWLVQQLWGIAWTIFGLAFGAVALLLLAINQTVLTHFGIPGTVGAVLLWARWIILILFSISSLAVFYYFGPNRPRVRWQWVSWGAVFATVAWLVTTSIFFAYVQNFANYTQSYSLFAGIIMLMVWLNLSALIVLIGAEVNYQLEVAGHKKWGGFLHRRR